MKKNIALFLCITLMAGCFGLTAALADEPIVIRFSSAAVQTDDTSLGIQAAQAKLEELSGGTMTIEAYYDSILYNSELAFPAVMAGDIEMCFTLPNYLTNQAPWLSMMSAGYLIKDYKHLRAVYDGDVGKAIYDRLAKELGLRPLNVFYQGARCISLGQDKEIKTPEDLKGITLRMPSSDAWVFMGESLGASVTPIALSELYTALQTGVVDGQDNPLPAVYSRKFYEVQKSITITNHYVSYSWPVINEAFWSKLTAEQQGWLTEAFAAGAAVCDESIQKNEASLVEFFKQQGLSIYYPDVDAFAEHVLGCYLNNKEMTSTWDMDLYDALVNIEY